MAKSIQHRTTSTSDIETDTEDNNNQETNIDDADETSNDSNGRIDWTKTQEYKELIREFRDNLVCAIKLQLKNASALVRRATVVLLEYAATTPLEIDTLLQSHVRRELPALPEFNFNSIFISSAGFPSIVHRPIVIGSQTACSFARRHSELTTSERGVYSCLDKNYPRFGQRQRCQSHGNCDGKFQTEYFR